MMRLLFFYGIIHTYFLVVNCGRQDCVVDEVYKEEMWDGREVNFFVYVMEIDVVNMKFTYLNWNDTNYFTTIYFSPNNSRRVETQNGVELDDLQLENMKIKNGWIEFKVSSKGKTVEVDYTLSKRKHVSININQPSTIFRDLTIRASNISLCNDKKQWKVSSRHPAIIPLGIKDFDLKFDKSNISPLLKINDGKEESLRTDQCTEYRKTTEKNNYFLQCKQEHDLKHQMKWKLNDTNIIVISTNEDHGFIITVTFDPDLPNSPTTTPKPVVYPSRGNKSCMGFNWVVSVTAITTILFFVIVLLPVYKYNIGSLRSKLENVMKMNDIKTKSNAEIQPLAQRNSENGYQCVSTENDPTDSHHWATDRTASLAMEMTTSNGSTTGVNATSASTTQIDTMTTDASTVKGNVGITNSEFV